MLAKDRHSNLFVPFVNYKCREFYRIVTWKVKLDENFVGGSNVTEAVREPRSDKF